MNVCILSASRLSVSRKGIDYIVSNFINVCILSASRLSISRKGLDKFVLCCTVFDKFVLCCTVFAVQAPFYAQSDTVVRQPDYKDPDPLSDSIVRLGRISSDYPRFHWSATPEFSKQLTD